MTHCASTRCCNLRRTLAASIITTNSFNSVKGKQGNEKSPLQPLKRSFFAAFIRTGVWPSDLNLKSSCAYTSNHADSLRVGLANFGDIAKRALEIHAHGFNYLTERCWRIWLNLHLLRGRFCGSVWQSDKVSFANYTHLVPKTFQLRVAAA